VLVLAAPEHSNIHGAADHVFKDDEWQAPLEINASMTAMNRGRTAGASDAANGRTTIRSAIDAALSADTRAMLSVSPTNGSIVIFSALDFLRKRGQLQFLRSSCYGVD
jgi:hypothetical protein